MDIFQTIFIFLGGTAIISAAIVWLSREIFKHFLSRDLEIFKNELEIKSIEYQIRTQTLHEKRALVIAELYSNFVASFRAYFAFFSPVDFDGISKTEKGKAANSLLNTFKDHFFINEIYFSKDICDLLHKYIEKCASLEIQFRRREKNIDKWDEVWGEFERDIVNKTLEILKGEFRKYLGVTI